MFKVIATDLDGTLLRKDKTISEYTGAVLAEAVKKGTELIICSGRMYDSMKYIVPQLPFCHYAISSMGADIYDNYTKERIYSKPLEGEYTEQLVAYGLENGLHMNIYIDDVLYANSYDKYAETYFRETTSKAIELDCDTLEFVKGKALSKLVFIDEPEKIKPHYEAICNRFSGKINICASDKRYVECSSIMAQKDITLNAFIKKLGYTRDELIVFGDSGNDVSMLKNTGFSVCVGNGWQEAKSVSHLIVESNKNDGVARTVSRLILKNTEV